MEQQVTSLLDCLAKQFAYLDNRGFVALRTSLHGPDRLLRLDTCHIDMLSFTAMRFPTNVILVCICWYEAYLLSYRHLE
jgi:putative transposase